MVALHYSNKGQLQMIETILVLFIFILILVFGIYFYYQYTFSGVQEEAFKISEKQATSLLSSITNLPELSCINEQDCVDIVKLINFKYVYSLNKLYYFNLFKRKKILIEQIYPETSQNICTFQNTFPLQCNSIVLHDPFVKDFESKSIISMPINIYYPNQNKYALGKISIEAYK